MKKFDQEARDFCDEIELQRAIFYNECGLLLHEIEEHEVVNALLESLEHKNWQDNEIDSNLARLLGGSLQGVQLTIKLLNQDLSRLSEDLGRLSEDVSQAYKVI